MREMAKFFSVVFIFLGSCSTNVEQILMTSNHYLAFYQSITSFIFFCLLLLGIETVVCSTFVVHFYLVIKQMGLML